MLDAKSSKFEITKVELSPQSEETGHNDQALYGFDVSRIDGGPSSTFISLFYRELFPFLIFFDVNKPEELMGKTFSSSVGTPAALEEYLGRLNQVLEF